MRIPDKPPRWIESLSEAGVVERFAKQPVQQYVSSANDKYLHWDKLRHLPAPGGLSPQQAWAAIGLSRASQFRTIPIAFSKKSKLKYWLPPQHQEWVSLIDLRAGGFIGTKRGTLPEDNERYLFNSLMEEAIASSQLEGASTTREVAKDMLRTHRTPRDKAERMIANNYKAILEIRDRKDQPLTPSLLSHLQQVLTEGTLAEEDASGRFRRSDESIRVVDNITGEALHDPPAASEIETRIEELCDFANAKSVPFVHPVVKAMALHFAIGYIHPFVDGNGRTARALFYWFMLKKGYWLFEYLPISRIIIGAPIRYGRAYLYTETDHGDLTYFNHYHLGVVIRAIDDLLEYLEEQQDQLREAEGLLDRYPELNHRQRALVQNALKDPAHSHTVREHEGKFRVTYNTARADLLDLERLGLLRRIKLGKSRENEFRLAEDAIAKLKKDR